MELFNDCELINVLLLKSDWRELQMTTIEWWASLKGFQVSFVTDTRHHNIKHINI